MKFMKEGDAVGESICRDKMQEMTIGMFETGL
jgi:hypothetical protein